jgi:putative hydrolase of the HAD superfamily
MFSPGVRPPIILQPRKEAPQWLCTLLSLFLTPEETLPMAFRAVVFDLFGTLVGNFSVQEYDRVLRRMAEALAMPYAEFCQHAGRNYHQREIGQFASLEESIASLCWEQLQLDVSHALVEQLAQYHYEYVANILVPDPGVAETLRAMKSHGLKIGLTSNCGPDVLRLWQGSALSTLIDVSVFSCAVGVRKPDPKIYTAACTGLGVDAASCIHVGDGSSEELHGAAQVGMYPVLKRVCLGDVYDGDRSDVKTWRGAEIQEISEIVGLIASTQRPSNQC